MGLRSLTAIASLIIFSAAGAALAQGAPAVSEPNVGGVAQLPTTHDGEAFARRYALVGKVAPRHAKDISANGWSVGAETMDRAYTTYEAWGPFVGPLGVKRARVQSGWARTEATKGQYDFSWLDPAINGIHAQGVSPWLSLGYGNPAYDGGGTPLRSSPLPKGQGLKAWLAYVRATAQRYNGKVNEWEIWNEPDLGKGFTGPEYGVFACDTAREIRKVNPNARILLAGYTDGVLAERGKSVDMAREILETFVKRCGAGYATSLTYHAYAQNPDDVYVGVERFRARMKAIDPKIEIEQGENGAPSLNQQLFALRNTFWTEQSQAKWLLRRMLGDNARGIRTSIFSLTDMHYPVQAETQAHFNRQEYQQRATFALNTKGLLETMRYAPGTPNEDQSIRRPKMGYRAMQSITSIFDDRLKPTAGACQVSKPGIAAYSWRRDDGASVVALWRTTERPDDRPMHEWVDVTCSGVSLPADAVYVDPLTTAAYRTTEVVQAQGSGFKATQVPVYDSPVLLATPSLVQVW